MMNTYETNGNRQLGRGRGGAGQGSLRRGGALAGGGDQGVHAPGGDTIDAAVDMYVCM